MNLARDAHFASFRIGHDFINFSESADFFAVFLVSVSGVFLMKKRRASRAKMVVSVVSERELA